MSSIWLIAKESVKGKSLYRTLCNQRLKGISIKGEGIDLGAKSQSSSYYRFMNIHEQTNIIYTDLYSEGEGIMKVDLEDEFPVEDESKDFLLMMNLLEHLFEYQTCVNESNRVLKTNGKLYGVVPFLHKFHPDPDDYFRYSISSLNRIFTKAGFKDIKIEPLGIGPLSAGYQQITPLIKIDLLKPLFLVPIVLFDKFLNKLFRGHPAVDKDVFPLGYYFECTK